MARYDAINKIRQVAGLDDIKVTALRAAWPTIKTLFDRESGQVIDTITNSEQVRRMLDRLTDKDKKRLAAAVQAAGNMVEPKFFSEDLFGGNTALVNEANSRLNQLLERGTDRTGHAITGRVSVDRAGLDLQDGQTHVVLLRGWGGALRRFSHRSIVGQDKVGALCDLIDDEDEAARTRGENGRDIMVVPGDLNDPDNLPKPPCPCCLRPLVQEATASGAVVVTPVEKQLSPKARPMISRVVNHLEHHGKQALADLMTQPQVRAQLAADSGLMMLLDERLVEGCTAEEESFMEDGVLQQFPGIAGGGGTANPNKISASARRVVDVYKMAGGKTGWLLEIRDLLDYLYNGNTTAATVQRLRNFGWGKVAAIATWLVTTLLVAGALIEAAVQAVFVMAMATWIFDWLAMGSLFIGLIACATGLMVIGAWFTVKTWVWKPLHWVNAGSVVDKLWLLAPENHRPARNPADNLAERQRRYRLGPMKAFWSNLGIICVFQAPLIAAYAINVWSEGAYPTWYFLTRLIIFGSIVCSAGFTGVGKALTATLSLDPAQIALNRVSWNTFQKYVWLAGRASFAVLLLFLLAPAQLWVQGTRGVYLLTWTDIQNEQGQVTTWAEMPDGFSHPISETAFDSWDHRPIQSRVRGANHGCVKVPRGAVIPPLLDGYEFKVRASGTVWAQVDLDEKRRLATAEVSRREALATADIHIQTPLPAHLAGYEPGNTGLDVSKRRKVDYMELGTGVSTPTMIWGSVIGTLVMIVMFGLAVGSRSRVLSWVGHPAWVLALFAGIGFWLIYVPGSATVKQGYDAAYGGGVLEAPTFDKVYEWGGINRSRDEYDQLRRPADFNPEYEKWMIPQGPSSSSPALSVDLTDEDRAALRAYVERVEKRRAARE